MHVFASQAELVRGWCYRGMDRGSCGLLEMGGMRLRLCGDWGGEGGVYEGGIGGVELGLSR